MCRHADATSTPSVFAVSLLFGGGSGALIAASFSLHGGAGFLVGATAAFVLLSVSVLRPRHGVEVEREPAARAAEADSPVKRPRASAF